MEVKVYEINTTAGTRYGLKHANDNTVCYTAWAKWKTRKGAERYAAKVGWVVVE